MIIPHNRLTLGAEEEKAAQRVLQSGRLVNGRETEAFELEFCERLNIPAGHAIATNSGTAALYLALRVLEASGKKIAFPAYVCSSLRHAVAMVGGEESLTDTSAHSPIMDFFQAENARADIAILPHLFGIPTEISSHLQKLEWIEDCAQALGAQVNGQSVGLQGTLGIFSFYATKLITSGGQGGMIVSKDLHLIEEIRDFLNFDGRKDDKRRFNFPLTEVQAAIGREQLKKLDSFLMRREEVFQKYREKGFTLVDCEPSSRVNLTPVRYRAIVRTKNPRTLIQKLAQHQIQAIIPIEEWEILGPSHLFPNAKDLALSTLSLPIYPTLSDSDVDRVISILEPLL